MSDIILIGIAAFLNLALTFAGLYVAVRPVEQETKKKRILLVCFVTCGFALGLAAYLAARGTKAQTHLQTTVDQISGKVSLVQESVDSLPVGSSARPAARNNVTLQTLPNGFLQFAKIQYVIGDELFTIGKPLQLNVYYINKGQAPVHNARITAAMALSARGGHTQKALDEEVLRTIGREVQAPQADKGATVGVDFAQWTTPSLPIPLTQQMVDGIMQGSLLLYVVSHAQWSDSYGKPKNELDCVWLNPPPNDRPPLNALVWQDCAR